MCSMCAIHMFPQYSLFDIGERHTCIELYNLQPHPYLNTQVHTHSHSMCGTLNTYVSVCLCEMIVIVKRLKQERIPALCDCAVGQRG